MTHTQLLTRASARLRSAADDMAAMASVIEDFEIDDQALADRAACLPDGALVAKYNRDLAAEIDAYIVKESTK